MARDFRDCLRRLDTNWFGRAGFARSYEYE
jgi:hypothetical protein